MRRTIQTGIRIYVLLTFYKFIYALLSPLLGTASLYMQIEKCHMENCRRFLFWTSCDQVCKMEMVPNPIAQTHVNWVEEHILEAAAALLTSAIVALGKPYIRSSIRRAQTFLHLENNAIINGLVEAVLGAEAPVARPAP